MQNKFNTPDHEIYNLASIKRFYEFTESDKNLATGENLKTITGNTYAMFKLR